MNQLAEFLNLHKAEKGAEYTHTSMGAPFKGSFFIPQLDLSRFYRLYKKVIEEKTKLHLTEKHKDVSPIVIDLDFRFPSSDGTERKYTQEHIKKVVSYYQAEIREAFEGDTTAYVYEKGDSGRLVKTRIKDGIHIMFPYIVLDPKDQLVMRRKVVKRVKDNEVFSDLNLANDEWDIFDEKVIDKAPWTMYGSCKPDDTAVYKISYVFDSDMDTRTVPDDRQLVEILSLRNKGQEEKVSFKDDSLKNEYTKLYDQWYKSKSKSKSSVSIDSAEGIDVEKIKRLVNMLDPKRATDYSDWVELGWCLHNISPGLLPVWEEFSKKSDKYEDGRCSEIWNKARSDGGLSLGTLYYWAKHDSPEEYKEFKKNKVYDEIIKSLNQQTDFSIAKVLYMMFGHKYVLASLKDKCWYEFISRADIDNPHKTVGLRWKPCEQGIFLRKRISKDLYEAYRESEKTWSDKYDKMSETEREEKRGMHEELHGKFSVMYKKLNTQKNKNDIMKSAEELFYYDDRFDKKFLEKLDSNRDLIGFENGVYDLSAPRMDEYGNVLKDENGMEICGVFREGKPSDYVSLSTNINYIPYDNSSEEVYRCMKFVKEIFPDKEMRDYVLTLFAYCLSGHISEEKFWIMIGQNSNGKSALLELYKHAFGQYFQTVSPKILTIKRGSPEGASPELAKLKGARFVAISEPEKDEIIQGGFVKSLTGGDDISCRKLYKEPISYKPQFKMFVLSNYFLKLNTTDGGVIRRLRAVECKVTFCDNPDENNEYEKKINRKLKDNFPDWAEAFMSILIEYYVDVYSRTSGGIKEPKEVDVYSKEYQRSVDDILEYMNENVVRSSEENTILGLVSLYKHFKGWFKDQKDGQKAQARKELQEAIEKKYGPAKRYGRNPIGWKGINLVEEELHGDSGEAEENDSGVEALGDD